ncbi:MAG: PQQ-binding-like beta-propeller repeat protein [Deltaproteobacteria bacterium]|nr:PQQ-binding-like beta-propeller repeat protein [Deltaproteobacteria bacterium]
MRQPVLLVRTLLLLSVAACSLRPATRGEPPEVRWQGQVTVTQDVTIARGTRLVVAPGTVVRFAFRDDDGDGWGDTRLTVQGELVAQGTRDEPIVFTSESQPAEPGQWGEVRLDYGAFDLDHVVLEGSTRGIHAHFTAGRLRNCVLRRNVDGTRLGESAVEVTDCLFVLNAGKAYNARLCRNSVRGNLFRQNRDALFLFDGDDGSTFEGNVLQDNEASLRLGDFFQGRVRAPHNDWGGPLPRVSEELAGAATLEASQVTVADAGPRAWPLWRPAWTASLGGFIDAGPVVTDEGVYAASWSGDLRRLGFLDGAVLARRRLPDAVDASLAPGPGVLAVPCWDRGLYLLTRGGLEVLDRTAEPPSPADDHRQASPVFRSDTLFVGTWSGSVQAYRTSAGRLERLWSFEAGSPFRGDLTLVGEAVLAPCQDGTLYALSQADGRPLWQYAAGAPLLSAAASDSARAYLADRGGVLHAVDLASGRGLWTAPLAGPVWYAPPLLHRGTLFQGDDAGRLWAVDAATGRVLWSRSLGSGIRSRPAWPAEGLLAVGTAGGQVYLLDAATGLERDAIRAGAAVFSSPAVAGSRVFVGSRDGTLRALDAVERGP